MERTKQEPKREMMLLRTKQRLTNLKLNKDGPSKGSCDVPRQNSPHSHSEPA